MLVPKKKSCEKVKNTLAHQNIFGFVASLDEQIHTEGDSWSHLESFDMKRYLEIALDMQIYRKNVLRDSEPGPAVRERQRDEECPPALSGTLWRGLYARDALAPQDSKSMCLSMSCTETFKNSSENRRK